jgi:hypothetical protein
MQASIDPDHFASHVARLSGGEEAHDAGDVLGG